ncbi:MAG: hypothetical protein WEC59_12225 [Salibacteraceae bacterium]
MMDFEEQFNFTNKQRHPTNDRIVVYRFLNREQADTFTELLVDAGIDFEAQIDEEHDKKPTYFGIKKARERETDRLNYLAIGRHRDKFIAAAPMRWIVIGISVVVLFLAFLGAFLSN